MGPEGVLQVRLLEGAPGSHHTRSYSPALPTLPASPEGDFHRWLGQRARLSPRYLIDSGLPLCSCRVLSYSAGAPSRRTGTQRSTCRRPMGSAIPYHSARCCLTSAGLWYARRHSLRSCPPRDVIGSAAAEPCPLGSPPSTLLSSECHNDPASSPLGRANGRRAHCDG